MKQFSNKYPLEERTTKFGEEIIDFCKSIPQNAITKPLISQLVRSATSIGANYMEANAASSRRDFGNKIHICKKEAQETMHWLRMITHYLPDKKSIIDRHLDECHQLVMIFQKITNSLKSRLNN